MFGMGRLSDKVFYEIFLITIVITWFPIKALAYIAPFAVIIWLLYRTNQGIILQRLILYLSIFGLILVFYFVAHQIVGTRFLLTNAVVSLLMYSPFLCLLVTPSPGNQDETYSYEKYAKVLVVVSWVQGTIGIFQYAAAQATQIASGDAVQGTISPLSFLASSAGFGNQIFAINIIFTLLFLLPYVLVYKKGRLAFLIGLIALLLALVVHAFIALLISAFLTVFLFREHLMFSQFKIFITAVGSIAFLIFAIAIVDPRLANTALVYLEAYESGDNPRTEAVSIATDKLPEAYPMVYFIGLGPGQYSSRAGLISSGYYFTGFDNPQAGSSILNSMSKPFREYFYPLWRSYGINDARYGNSTMSRPFFSVLSVYTEFGLLFLGLIFLVFVYYIYQMRRIYIWAFQRKILLNRWLALTTGTAIVFLITVSFFENYLETAQAIFPGMLLMKKFYSTLQQQFITNSYKNSEAPAAA